MKEIIKDTLEFSAYIFVIAWMVWVIIDNLFKMGVYLSVICIYIVIFYFLEYQNKN